MLYISSLGTSKLWLQPCVCRCEEEADWDNCFVYVSIYRQREKFPYSCECPVLLSMIMICGIICKPVCPKHYEKHPLLITLSWVWEFRSFWHCLLGLFFSWHESAQQQKKYTAKDSLTSWSTLFTGPFLVKLAWVFIVKKKKLQQII